MCLELHAAVLCRGPGRWRFRCVPGAVCCCVFQGAQKNIKSLWLGAGWSVYAQADHINNSSRLTFKSPLGMKLKSLKEVEKFLVEAANAPRVPAKGALVEAEMTDEHTKKTEWVQGTITKVLAGPKTGSFRVEFKVENAEEKGTWEETYKVFFFCVVAPRLFRLAALPLIFQPAAPSG